MITAQSEMVRVAAPGVQPDGLVDIDEIAQHCKRSVSTIRRWVRLFGFPYQRPGGPGSPLLFRKSDVDRWIQERTAREHCGRPLTSEDYIGVQRFPDGESIHLYTCPRCRSSVPGPAPEALDGGGRGVVMDPNDTDGGQ